MRTGATSKVSKEKLSRFGAYLLERQAPRLGRWAPSLGPRRLRTTPLVSWETGPRSPHLAADC